MSASPPIDQAYTEAFLGCLEWWFRHGTLFDQQFEWIAGRAHPAHVAVFVFRDRRDDAVLGCRWDLAEFAPRFDRNDPSSVAETVWLEVNDPTGPGEQQDVDWAIGLVPEPRRVRWLYV